MTMIDQNDPRRFTPPWPIGLKMKDNISLNVGLNPLVCARFYHF